MLEWGALGKLQTPVINLETATTFDVGSVHVASIEPGPFVA
jgi:hypothetical protein